MNKKNAKVDILTYLFGELISKGIPFFVLPYLTRTLGGQEYGELAFSMTLVGLVSILISLSFDGSIVRYYYRYGKNSLGKIVTVAYLLSSFLYLAIIVFLIVVLDDELFYVLIIVSSISYTQALNSIQLGLRQCQKKSKEYVTIQIVNGFTSLIFTVLLLEFISPSFENRLIAVLIANIISFSFASLISDTRLNTSTYRIKLYVYYILGFGFPLIIHKISLFSKGQIDKFFIYNTYDSNTLGHYAAAFQLASVLIVLFGAINKALVPYFYGMLSKDMLRFEWINKSLLIITIFTFIVLLSVYQIPDSFYSLLLGNEFAELSYFVSVFAFGFTWQLAYFLLVNIFFYYGENKLISVITFVSSFFYIFLVILFKNNLFLIPLAIVISNVFTVIMLYILLMRKFTSFKKG